MSEDITKELWATYSVKDHLEPRALAADIMLFDRLVFPVPEKPHLPNSAPAHMPGPVEWRADATEWARWGATRICAIGQMQNPPLTWRHDGRPSLGDLVTWTDWEQ